MAESKSKPPISLVLLGAPGSGKSSTGNSILRQTCFKTSVSGRSESSDMAYNRAEIGNYDIYVIDFPSLIDEDVKSAEISHQLAKNMQKLETMISQGITAFIYVVKFGSRFTQENRTLLNKFKLILGHDFLARSGIVVVTCGDSFHSEPDTSDFKIWIRQQDGDLAELFQECNYRCVLFNNRAKDVKQMNEQIRELINLAITIQKQGPTYAMRHQKQEKPVQIRFLLMGSSGSGKSSTGNSILKSKRFQTSASARSEKSSIVCESVRYQMYELQVIHALSLDDQVSSDEDICHEAMRTMANVMEMVPDGLSAFLFVVKYGNPISKETKYILSFLKTKLGEDLLKDFGIVVISGGDNFQSSKEEGEVSEFEEWVRNVDGDLGQLVQECQFRCVLFNNREKNEMKQDQQVQNLIHVTETLNVSRHGYCNKKITSLDMSTQTESMVPLKQLEDLKKKISTLSENVDDIIAYVK